MRPQHSLCLLALLVTLSEPTQLLAAPELSSSAKPLQTLSASPIRAAAPTRPQIIPAPPSINAKAYILIDANSGKIIAEKNSEQKLQPASLTKMMTLYVLSNALDAGQIHLTDTLRISRNAWRTGGSRMFVKEGQQVPIQDLLKGIIVDSGNDACVAIAEHLGGSEEGFVELMNQQAKNLGMSSSHFTDSTGLPHEQLYSTAKDLAILGRALINHFPQYYHWYKQKWFSYNGIRQPNRNRLLWRDNQVDGLKTGHTNEAGYCLVSSAKHDNMRLISVVLGSPSDLTRADDSERLLNYGFRFFETHPIYQANAPIATIPVYKGNLSQLKIGLHENQYITIPSGSYDQLKLHTDVPKNLQAPIKVGDEIGKLIIRFNDQVLDTQTLYALESIPKGGIFRRMKDAIRLTFQRWFN
ncbi:MAG: D-alanyl-D-alanine carboxypeptidase [Legionella sp.]|nr:D-alanyl-D-alanine carboxypeptidase [Legionella sp.]